LIKILQKPIYQIPTFDPAPKTVDQIMVGLHERIKRRKTMPKTQHLPSFIIIGVKKCGTSALSRFLKVLKKLYCHFEFIGIFGNWRLR